MTKQRALFWFSILTAFVALILIFSGGLVTSTDSGLAVPDWPLSFGTLFPEMQGGVIFEHSHRVIAGSVGVLTLLLTIGLIAWEKRGWFKLYGALLTALVVLQALLGGLTVLMKLPTAVSVLHACVAQLFFSLMCLVPLFLSDWWKNVVSIQDPSSGKIEKMLRVACGLIFLQLILGAIVRHSGGQGIMLHILGAFLVMGMIVPTSMRIMTQAVLPKQIQCLANAWAFCLLLQVLLGVAAFVVTRSGERAASFMALIPTAHQSVGAAILAIAVLLLLTTSRIFRKAT